VRTERVLMHGADPLLALTELARVTRPGGRIVLVEPDHRRLAIDTDAPDVHIRIGMAFATMIPNNSAGLRAPSDAMKLGLTVEAIEPIPCLMRSHAQFLEVFNLEVGRESAHAQGVTDAEFDTFLDELATRGREGRFLAVAMMYVVVLTTP
jgi:ubiquinone/menaquinone biosynthesis C-methylase UbiE